MKQVTIRIVFSLIIISISLGWGIYFQRSDVSLRALVKVEMGAYYVVSLPSGDSLCFSEISLIDRSTMRVDTFPYLRNVSLNGKYSQLLSEYWGFIVSRDGEVQVALPKIEDTLSGDAFKETIKQTLERLEKSNVIARQHLHELEYYHRTHSIIDDGFQEVMQYAEAKRKEFTNNEFVVQKLKTILQIDNPIAIKRSYLRVNDVPYICVYQHNGLSSLTPQSDALHLRFVDGGELLSILQPQVHKKTHQFLDSLQTYYQLVPDSLGYRGSSLTIDDIYYEGQFDSLYRKDGFGFQIDQQMVKCGLWKNNHFQGERMIYTADRVYGIDISRYQHERGKKKYSIHWDKLRIRNLGTISNKRIHGTVDYPVSFVFIKATEGVSVRNRYFEADLKTARKHQIPVAAYHFFSPRLNGAAQARYFLKYAKTRLGTLPPMLDVEPSHEQIRRMGGVEVLFREVLTWLKIVEQHTGRRPLLYVSQSFVNRYMSDAPEALRKYPVWIARYGEFKPYVKLLLWQLSPDGCVQGITGDVDINVFNGSKSDFQQWIASHR